MATSGQGIPWSPESQRVSSSQGIARPQRGASRQALQAPSNVPSIVPVGPWADSTLPTFLLAMFLNRSPTSTTFDVLFLRHLNTALQNMMELAKSDIGLAFLRKLLWWNLAPISPFAIWAFVIQEICKNIAVLRGRVPSKCFSTIHRLTKGSQIPKWQSHPAFSRYMTPSSETTTPIDDSTELITEYALILYQAVQVLRAFVQKDFYFDEKTGSLTTVSAGSTANETAGGSKEATPRPGFAKPAEAVAGSTETTPRPVVARPAAVEATRESETLTSSIASGKPITTEAMAGGEKATSEPGNTEVTILNSRDILIFEAFVSTLEAAHLLRHKLPWAADQLTQAAVEGLTSSRLAEVFPRQLRTALEALDELTSRPRSDNALRATAPEFSPHSQKLRQRSSSTPALPILVVTPPRKSSRAYQVFQLR